MQKLIFVILLIIPFCLLQAQSPSGLYSSYSGKADSLFSKKQYASAIQLYNKAFESNAQQGMVKHRYNLACCWASLNNSDSAFFQLNRIATKGKFFNYFQLQNDSHLAALKKDKRWDELIIIVKNNSREIEEKLNEQIQKNAANGQD